MVLNYFFLPFYFDWDLSNKGNYVLEYKVEDDAVLVAIEVVVGSVACKRITLKITEQD